MNRKEKVIQESNKVNRSTDSHRSKSKISTQILFFVCVFIFWALPFTLYPNISYSNELPFPKGETIEYKITQFMVTMGRATIQFQGLVEKKGQPLYLIVFEGKGSTFYDEELIYVDPNTWHPVIVERDLDIFNNKEKITEEYLPEQGKIKITKIADGETTVQWIEKEFPVDNLYGFIYRFREQKSLALGKTYDIRLPTKDVTMEALKQHNYRLSGERREAIYMNSDPSAYQVWFGVADPMIPYKIKGSFGIANTAMEFEEYSIEEIQ